MTTKRDEKEMAILDEINRNEGFSNVGRKEGVPDLHNELYRGCDISIYWSSSVPFKVIEIIYPNGDVEHDMTWGFVRENAVKARYKIDTQLLELPSLTYSSTRYEKLDALRRIMDHFGGDVDAARDFVELYSNRMLKPLFIEEYG